MWVLVGVRRDFGEGTDTHLELHNVSVRLGPLQREAHILHLRLARSRSLGHSLAEAALHHHIQVVVQDSLCHSPGSLLGGPRLMVVPAQGAGERERQVDGEIDAR